MKKSFGYDTGYIAGCKEMPAFLEIYGDLQPDGHYKLSTSTDSLITSILSAGTFVGALAASTIGDWLGRRLGIAIYVVIFSVGVALQTGGNSLGAFAAGRVLAGLGVGGTSVLVPVYQAECAPRKIRGMIVSGYQWFITVGLLIAAIVVDQTKDRKGKSAFQIPIGIQFVWGAILGFGLILLPESPRWLLFKGREDDARRSLAKLASQDLDSQAVTEEYDEILATLETERQHGGGSWADCFRMGKHRVFQRVATGMALQAFSQLSGINFIFYYGTSFFSTSLLPSAESKTISESTVELTGSRRVGYLQPLPHHHRDQRRQRRHDHPRYAPRRQDRPPAHAPLRQCWYGCFPAHRRCRRRRAPHHGPGGPEGPRGLCVHLHRPLCVMYGTP